jgi:hypothetical protein
VLVILSMGVVRDLPPVARNIAVKNVLSLAILSKIFDNSEKEPQTDPLTDSGDLPRGDMGHFIDTVWEDQGMEATIELNPNRFRACVLPRRAGVALAWRALTLSADFPGSPS